MVMISGAEGETLPPVVHISEIKALPSSRLRKRTGEVVCGLPGAGLDSSPSILVDSKPNGLTSTVRNELYISIHIPWMKI
ncbi:hypothetical protein AVEN_114998-1 [Araneus ventricosus]|uniref:Uncharacterized protein n=1 Tax=Araneus ventricosus TaxID=182803 RepID=A0A4Y1ZWT6_ARAVE|nr:hypothetical protein AVEN_114998-1 [Araneus ventricosus]